MKRTLKLIAWGSVLFAGVYSIPNTTVYARDTSDPLQSFCLMAIADAKTLGESLHGNVKAICN